MKRKKGIGRKIKQSIRWLTSGFANYSINAIARLSAPGFLFRFTPVTRSQVGPKRLEVMKTLLHRHFPTSMRMIEVGSWFGEGSTRMWVEALPVNSNLTLIDAWTPYVTPADLSKGALAYKSMDDVAFAAFHNTALQVLKYETQRPDLEINLIKAKSASFLRMMTDEFDLVYIDGSHYYEAVKADLVNAKKLVKKDFSIICGDDYEMHSDNELIGVAKENLDRDWITHPRGSFHPGVLMAIAEEFGEVNMQDGFWWTICRNGKFGLT